MDLLLLLSHQSTKHHLLSLAIFT